MSSPTRLSIFRTQRLNPYKNFMRLVLPEAFAPNIKDIFNAFLLPSALVSISQRLFAFAFEDVGSVVKEQLPLNER